MAKINTDDWKHLIGKQFVPENESVPTGVPTEQIIRKSDLPSKHRVLGPNAITTRDFIQDRLNVHVDNSNVIKSVNIG
ncbi:hypothetical protein G9A89_007163 [Geosiphon pyriformis]|nr:hypothetical protein G9A89_007163 [Geosiphon pyriformis]